MEKSRERPGSRAAQVKWIEAGITEVSPPENHYDIWHDRAVFRFLTAPKDRRKYVELVLRSLKIGGHIVVASFGENGSQKCSGSDVTRYRPEAIRDEFGDEFNLVKSFHETHKMPFGTNQKFVYCCCRKLG